MTDVKQKIIQGHRRQASDDSIDRPLTPREYRSFNAGDLEKEAADIDLRLRIARWDKKPTLGEASKRKSRRGPKSLGGVRIEAESSFDG
jgi:hypothetical protein